MDIPSVLSPIPPRLLPFRSHARNASRSPTRSPTRERITDDILADLSPATTLDVFTNPSGKLKASVEAATPAERAFGIRATLASKKIQEWVDELSSWPWPAQGGSEGFEMPAAKRRKTPDDVSYGRPETHRIERHGSRDAEDEEYMGSLPAHDVEQYETRVEEITEDMEDLDVEAIKRQVLDTHFSPRSRPSSSASSASMPSLLPSYTKMDDLTAIVTATVLRSLPNLSKLLRLMDLWSIRLAVLTKVPPLLSALDDAEMALRAGWDFLQHSSTEGNVLSRQVFGSMREVMQAKVTQLGQDLDYMLDTLEGREDILPEIWLDRMEAIEHDYGEWVVSGDRKIRQGEWEMMAKARREAEEAQRLKDTQTAEAERLKAEDEVEESRKLQARLAAKEAEDARRNAEVAEKQAGLDAEAATEKAQQKSEQDALDAKILAEAEAADRLAKYETQVEKAKILDAESAKNDQHKTEQDKLDVKSASESKAAKRITEQAKDDLEETKRLGVEAAAEESSRRNTEKMKFVVDFDLAIIQSVELQTARGQREDAAAEQACPQFEVDAHEIKVPGEKKGVADAQQRPKNIFAMSVDKTSSAPQTPSQPKLIDPESSFHTDLYRVISNVESAMRRRASSPVPACGEFQGLPSLRSEVPVGNTSQHTTQIGNSLTKTVSLPLSYSTTTRPSTPTNVMEEFSHEPSTQVQPADSRPSTSGGSQSSFSSNRASKRHGRNISTSSSYPISKPSPEVLQAAPAQYFRPILSPVETTFFEREGGSFSPTTTVPSPVEQEDLILDSVEETPRRPSVFSVGAIRRASDSSDTPTIVSDWPGDGTASPPTSTPVKDYLGSFSEADELSPTAGRVGLRTDQFYNSSPLGPPQFAQAPQKQALSANSPVSPTFSSISDAASTMSSDPPYLRDVEVSQQLPLSSSKKTSDEQLRQQISSLLESIPARIRLSSEPDVTSSNTLRPKKTRRSVTPSFRSHSSMSSRATTPSFLLSPAYTKAAPRPRHQNAHPEIKLYHLSRSTGEAPIKLFVRLVGEHGERVMVRVGGGWADLGEYLKEYASHHGRRSKAENDKVEIQDLPPRIVSSSSTHSTVTIRGSDDGRSSPIANFRPGSAFDRPVSSLGVRKARKSLGESSTAESIRNYRRPSTPFTQSSRSFGETPPSISSNTSASRTSSRLSWNEEDSTLGLAGPKGKKIIISESDQEWVESMKEKVRLASAEKDREKEKRLRGASFGALEQVGGTKRLFRRG